MSFMLWFTSSPGDFAISLQTDETGSNGSNLDALVAYPLGDSGRVALSDIHAITHMLAVLLNITQVAFKKK